MNETSRHLIPLTLRDTPSAISSPELVAGASPSDLPDGPMTDLFGRVVALASPLVVRESLGGGAIPAIFGRRGISSSASAALQSSLVSRLKAQLPTGGLTLFRMTWSEKATPSGRSVCLLRASAHRTADNGCGSWPTPTAQDNDQVAGEYATNGTTLGGASRLSSWATPSVSDSKGAPTEAASWPTPNAGPQNDGDTTWEARREALKAQHKNGNGYGSWATPTTRDHKDGHAASCQNVPVNCLLGRQIHLCGSPAETAKPGQLNPAFSLWLMGYPIAWGSCAARVTPSSRKSRQRLSPPTKR